MSVSRKRETDKVIPFPAAVLPNTPAPGPVAEKPGTLTLGEFAERVRRRNAERAAEFEALKAMGANIPAAPLSVDPVTGQLMQDYIEKVKEENQTFGTCPACMRTIKKYEYNWRSKWEGNQYLRFKCPACSPQIEARKRAKQAEENINRLFGGANIPAYGRLWRFENLPEGHDEQAAQFIKHTTQENIELQGEELKRLSRLSEEEEISPSQEPAMATSIYAYGELGRGKTSMLISAAYLYMENGIAVFYEFIPVFFDKIRKTINDRNSPFCKLEETAASVPVLFLDDLGSENVTDWTIERFFMLLEQRRLSGLITYISSNLSIEALEKKMKETAKKTELLHTASRIADRIYETYAEVEVQGVNLRRKMRERR